MASLCVFSLVTIVLVLQIWPSLSSLLDIFGDVCKSSDQCGKGTCRASNETTFGFECVCDAGWKQTRSKDDDGLKFLPCVIPNCTLNTSCNEAPSPAPQANRSNVSFLDPCSWAECGGGTCNKTSPFTHNCNCQEGFYNILNVSAFPCYRDCSLGMDCSNLGINLNNRSSSSSPPNMADNSQSKGCSFSSGHLRWLIFSVMLLALVM